MTLQEKTKKQAEVMLAYANGAEIEFKTMATDDRWETILTSPAWDWLHADYRVKKPAPKVVKLEAWIDTHGELRRCRQYHILSNSWKRIPQLDMEYTEDES